MSIGVVEMVEVRVFPVDFPPCCPPDDAVDADCVAYRITMNDPPMASDFESDHERGRQPRYPLKSKSQKCSWRGISVYQSLKDALHHLDMFGRMGKFIAVGCLKPESGKTKVVPTGDSQTHTNWWCYVCFDQIKRTSLFKTYTVT